MPLILPSYLMHERRFKCDACGFGFIKKSPSAVEKCPKCSDAAYDRNADRNNLDKYSQTKERWYKNHSERHIDDIRHREVVYRDGQQETAFVDDKGRIIDYAVQAPIREATKVPTQAQFKKDSEFIR